MSIDSKADLNTMTDDWHRLTRQANDYVDEAVKEAQDLAYGYGLARGREQLLDFSRRLNAAKANDDQREWSALIDAICKLTATAEIESPAVKAEPVGKMTAQRAKFFLERFKREEKLLGPNEQAGLNYAIAALEREQYAPAAKDEAEPLTPKDTLREDVARLLWDHWPECCGCPEPALLNDAQIVRSLRALVPAALAAAKEQPCP